MSYQMIITYKILINKRLEEDLKRREEIQDYSNKIKKTHKTKLICYYDLIKFKLT
jgi:hypothetical protein